MQVQCQRVSATIQCFRVRGSWKTSKRSVDMGLSNFRTRGVSFDPRTLSYIKHYNHWRTGFNCSWLTKLINQLLTVLITGRAALQKRIMSLLRQLDRRTAGNMQVLTLYSFVLLFQVVTSRPVQRPQPHAQHVVWLSLEILIKLVSLSLFTPFIISDQPVIVTKFTLFALLYWLCFKKKERNNFLCVFCHRPGRVLTQSGRGWLTTLPTLPTFPKMKRHLQWMYKSIWDEDQDQKSPLKICR